MSLSANSAKDDEPLDPAVERVQRKLRSLMVVAMLTLGIGLVAVLGAILYRISNADDSKPVKEGAVIVAEAPEGATLVSAVPGGDGNLLLTYSHAGGNTILLIDGKSLKVRGRLELRPGKAPAVPSGQ